MKEDKSKQGKAISLEEILELYKHALEETSLLVIADSEGRITYANREFCSVTGYTSEELCSGTHNIINSGLHDNEFYSQLWKTIGEGNIWRGQFCNIRKNGEPFKLRTTIFPFPANPKKPFKFLSVSREISEDDQVSVSLRANGTNHQAEVFGLRSALFSLKQLTNLLEETPLDGEQSLLIEKVRETIEGIDALSSISKVGVNGNNNPSPAEIHPGQILCRLPQPQYLNGNAQEANLRILIAEDVQINQLVMQKHLENMNFSYEFANNGSLVIEKLEHKSFDIILMDMQMPVMDGRETIRQIRSSRGGYAHIPIIAITASIKGDALAKCLEAGADEYLPKPFDIAELNSKILKLTSGKRKNIHMEKQSVPSTKSEETIIDLEYLEQLSEGDKDFITSMIQYFTDNTPAVLDSMKESYKQNDWTALRNIAHKFKPQLNFMGINSLLDDAEQLEQNAHQEKNLEQIPDLIQRIDRICTKAIEQLKKLIDQQNPE